mgnify:CR=1 FL=1
MPRYSYFCESCKNGFEITHSIKERLEKCENCQAYALRKLPSIPIYITKNKEKESREVGSLVEEYIEKNKEQLKDEKKKFKEAEYK